ncbi:MAG TPA: response regulator, partial [Burkholderiales bacterium]|nr:response regulator [Burkholderiales bacterium]
MNLTNLRVLIVDDNAFAREMVGATLHALGVRQVFTEDNAVDGLATLRSVSPDLVLLDWVMESVDGLAFVKGVRGDRASPLRFIPIVVVTAYSELWRVQEARDAGANEFIVKPFAAVTLYHKIRTLIENPRPFVDVPDGYFGPDRRRRNDPVTMERRNQPVAAPLLGVAKPVGTKIA